MYLGYLEETAGSMPGRFVGPAGMGDADSTAKFGGLSTSTFAAVAGSFTPQIATLLSLSIPVVGVAIAGITLALTAIFMRKGPKQKEMATQAVNQVTDLMRQNLNEYMAGPRTAESQMVAVANFDRAWAWLEGPDGCGNPALGSAGQRCISERMRGGTAPWCPAGQVCDMFTTLRDPIANDTRPAELQAQGSGLPASLTDSLTSFTSPISLPGGLEVSPLVLVGAALVAWGLSKS